jgi:hypothetical protein
MNRDELYLLAWQLDQRGPLAVAAMEPQLAALARDARQAGVRPVAAAVLADRDAPVVARIRAFGLVAAALDREPPDQLVAA